MVQLWTAAVCIICGIIIAGCVEMPSGGGPHGAQAPGPPQSLIKVVTFKWTAAPVVVGYNYPLSPKYVSVHFLTPVY